jgi:hypothetical protein
MLVSLERLTIETLHVAHDFGAHWASGVVTGKDWITICAIGQRTQHLHNN